MSENNNKVNPLTKRILQFVLPLLLTILLVWWLFHKVNFGEMMDIIRGGCNLWWIGLAMFLSIFSHVIRAARWQLQLSSLGIRPPFMALCCSIFGCYALNLLFPRLGEVWRCTYISTREKAPFTKVFGSVVADRLADMALVALLLLFAFFVAHDAIASFLGKYPVGADLLNLIANPLVWAAVAASALIVVAVVGFFGDTKPVIRVRGWLTQLWHGFADVARMPRRGRFILYSLLLWGCYYIQLYVAFFAFPFTAELCRQPSLAFGLQPCLVAFVLSSISMAVPSNGGLGPWNIAIMFGLALYGINDAEGTAFSIIQWSGETIMLMLLGLFTIAWISATRKSKMTLSSR